MRNLSGYTNPYTNPYTSMYTSPSNSVIQNSWLSGGQLDPHLQAQLDALGGLSGNKLKDAQRAYEQTANPLMRQLEGEQQYRDQMQQGTGQMQDVYRPYQQAGDQALEQQMALLGLRGDAAMQSAYGNNPAHAFAQQQMEKGLMRNASAMGGLRGNDVQRELAQYTSGLTNQNIQNQLAQLGGISSQGYNAAQNIAGGYRDLGQSLGKSFRTDGQLRAGQYVDSQSIQARLAEQRAAARARRGSGFSRALGALGGIAQVGMMFNPATAGFGAAMGFGSSLLSGIGGGGQTQSPYGANGMSGY